MFARAFGNLSWKCLALTVTRAVVDASFLKSMGGALRYRFQSPGI